MFHLCKLVVGTVIDLLRSRAMLEAEILLLRQQINVLRRASPKRLRFASIDRLILRGICRLFPEMYDTLAIVRPDTVMRWHRAGFRLYWRSRSRRCCGRPTVSLEIRRLIREMSIVPAPRPAGARSSVRTLPAAACPAASESACQWPSYRSAACPVAACLAALQGLGRHSDAAKG
jgi:hypothetical protein